MIGYSYVEEPGSCKEEEGAEVPIGLEAGVGNLVSTGNMSLSIIGVVLVGTAPLVFVPSPMCSTLNRWMTLMSKRVI